MHISQALLVIADISGYTRFMIANRTELEHGHQIIATLLEEIIEEAEIPLTIAKIEGDAVFLYMETGGADVDLRSVALKLPRIFRRFATKLQELGAALTCGCQACSNVGQLRLKVVVHSGETLVYEIAGRTELAGVDVIIVHRLLKNSLTSREYLLLTEAAQRDLALELPIIEALVEDVDDIGPMRVTAYQP
jgi:class 3 adenylate cyclase